MSRLAVTSGKSGFKRWPQLNPRRPAHPSFQEKKRCCAGITDYDKVRGVRGEPCLDTRLYYCQYRHKLPPSLDARARVPDGDSDPDPTAVQQTSTKTNGGVLIRDVHLHLAWFCTLPVACTRLHTRMHTPRSLLLPIRNASNSGTTLTRFDHVY